LITEEAQRIADRDEATLLGLIMFPDLAEVFDDVLRIVRPQDFLSPARELIWRVASGYRAAGEHLDIGALHSAVAAAQSGARLNTVLDVITRECVTPPVAEHALLAAERVAGAARNRRLGSLAQRLQQLTETGADHDDPEYGARIREVVREIEDIDSDRYGDDVSMIADYAHEYLGDLTAGPPAEVIPTPWQEINGLFSGGGLRPGGFYLIGARPGDGKTLAGGAIAMTAAEQGYSGLVFSAEMTRRELMDRWMARALREELSEFTSFAPGDRVLAGAAAHAEWISANGLRLGVVDKANMSVPYIATTSRRHQRRIGLDFIVIDYIQLLTATGGRNREEAVGDMSTALKQLAKELSIPVIALAQLNRNGGGDGPPRKEHLRETGRLEQDADGIILIHRPMVEIDGERRPDGTVEFIIDKNRHGRTGTVSLRWRAHWGDITDKD
jgi:replicative DNA helicase